jgi:hypothetical protein
MQVQEHTLGTPKIEEINDKFPTSNAYQSKKGQTEVYVTNNLQNIMLRILQSVPS